LDPDTGAIKFHFQYTPHDVWDFDGVNNAARDAQWSAMDCLVERAEFELRCGLKAALCPTVASQEDLCVAATGSRQLNRAR
jgi:hypothetical protein